MNMWNFAASGATIDRDLIECGDTHSMTEQYTYFDNQMGIEKKYSNWNGGESLVTIWFGINDMMNKLWMVYWKEISVTPEEFDVQLTDTMYSIVEKIYSHGARNFMFFNLPPMEKYPWYIDEVWDVLPSYVKNYNENIDRIVKKFHDNYPKANVFLFNAHEEFNYLIENKEQFNITDVTGFPENGENSDSFLWRDWNHPTQRIQKMIAEEIDEFLTKQEEESKKITGYKGSNKDRKCSVEDSGYPCCSEKKTTAVFRDTSGAWAVEHGDWCGLLPSKIEKCWGRYIGYSCCKTDTCKTPAFEAVTLQWAVEDDHWCTLNNENTVC